MNVLAIYCDENKCIPKLYSSVNRYGSMHDNKITDYSLLDNDIFDFMFNAVNMKKGIDKVSPRRYTRKRETQRVNKKSRKKKNRNK